jgi:hypothetical protein
MRNGSSSTRFSFRFLITANSSLKSIPIISFTARSHFAVLIAFLSSPSASIIILDFDLSMFSSSFDATIECMQLTVVPGSRKR